jgi:CRP-like cAMP-binding protein
VFENADLEELERMPLFAGCSRRELKRIRAHMSELAIRPSAVLAREGRPGNECFVIVEGRARVALGGETLTTLGPGDLCGEMALLERAPRSATVTAETPMRVYVLNPAEFGALLQDAPLVARRIVRTWSERRRLAASVRAGYVRSYVPERSAASTL